MKLHKLISRTVVAIALLGATFGGAFSLNPSAAAGSTGPIGIPSSQGNSARPGSSSNFVVNNGLLTLDSVPSLNFSNSSSDNGSNILKLNNNSNTNDNSTLLEVTDYRNSNSKNNDWGLTASMGPVNQISAPNGQNQQKVNSQWELDLFNQNNSEVRNLDNSGTPNIENTRLLSNNQGSVSDQNNTIMNRSTSGSSTSNGYGVNQIRYDNENDAQLITPNVVPGTYQTEITWNLNTTVSATNNLGNNDTNLNNTNTH